MSFLLVLLCALWPEGWYEDFRLANQKDALEHVRSLPDSIGGREPALALSMHYAGEFVDCDSLVADSSDFRYWTVLGVVLTDLDLLRAAAAFQHALTLAPVDDPVLLEAFAYLNLLDSNPDEAYRLASAALQADPGFVSASLTAAWALEDMGRPLEAVGILDRGIALHPLGISLLEEKAAVLESLGMSDSALAVYERVLAVNPSRVHTLRRLAALYEDVGRQGHAVKTHRRILETNPEDYWALGQLGFIMERLGRTELAVEYYREGVELNASHAWFYHRLALLSDDPFESVVLLENAVGADSTLGSAWLDLGLAYENTGELDKAENALSRSLLYSPSSWTWGELGWVQESLGKFSEAAVSYEMGVALDSAYSYGWQRRGSLFREAGDDSAALEWLARALVHLGEDPWVLGEMGSIHLNLGNTAGAEEFFARAVEANPDYGFGLLNLVWLYKSNSDYTSSMESLERYLDLSTADPEVGLVEMVFNLEAQGSRAEADSIALLLPGGWAYISYGWTALGFGYPDYAAIAADRAMIETGDSPWDWIELGELFESLEMPQKAQECYEMAANTAGDDASVHREIAGYFYRTGDYAGAGNRLSMALGIDSTSVVLAELGEARLFEGRLRDAEAALMAALDRDPSSVFAICYLGLIEERRGNPDKAAQRYLDALRIMPGYSYAESRILYITSGEYDRRWHTERYSPLSWNLWTDLSFSRGNTEESVISGGAMVGLNYVRGSSVKLRGSTRLEEKNSRRERESAFASLAVEHFFSERLFAGLSSSWDRQPLTVRPWQLSSYLAAGWKSWPADWIWFAPEVGVGLVNTRWSVGDERTDRVTSYASFGVWMRRPRQYLPHLWLAGSVYLPPRDTRHAMAYGTAELDFDLPGPLSLLLGLNLDYTRTPAVESWENVDLDYYLRLRLGN